MNKNYCLEFSGPEEPPEIEPQDNEEGKIINFKHFSIYLENFK